MKILLAAPVNFDRITLFVSDFFVGLAHAAIKLGHQARLVQSTENMYNPFVLSGLSREFLTMRHYCKKLVDIPHDILLMRQLWQEVVEFEPDIVILHVLDTSYLQLLLPKIKSRGIKVLVWLGIHPSQVSKDVHSLLRSADYTLCYDRSYSDYYHALGIHNILNFPLGCNVGHFDSIEPDDSFKARHAVDVCFVGQFDRHRERYLRELSVFNLGIWSWNIDEFETPLRKFNRGAIYGDDLIRLYKSCKIVVNIHRSFEHRGGNYRLFEIPAAGAFQIVDDKPGLGEYFTIDKELVTFHDEHDLRDKVAHFLTNESERMSVATAGHERVMQDHALEHRVAYLLNSIKGANES